MSTKRNADRAHAHFSSSVERQHAAELRRSQLIATRPATDRVLQYAASPKRCVRRALAGRPLRACAADVHDADAAHRARPVRSYQSETREANKSALDAQATQRQDSQQRDRQAEAAADEMVLRHARLQETQIQRQQQLRLDHQRETAAYNLRIVQEQQAAREHQKAAARQQAQALEERSFFDRFGTSLA